MTPNALSVLFGIAFFLTLVAALAYRRGLVQTEEFLRVANRSTADEIARADKAAVEATQLAIRLDRSHQDIRGYLADLDRQEDVICQLMTELAAAEALVEVMEGEGRAEESMVGVACPGTSPDPVWLALLKQGRAGEAAREAVRGMGIGQGQN